MLFFLTIFGVFFIRNASGWKNCDDCISITKCKPAMELVTRNKSAETVEFLRSAQCGYTDILPKICCSDFAVSRFAYEKSYEDEIENHPNVNLLPSVCGNIEGNRIVGGDIADLYEFPWIVLISYKAGRSLKFNCGGTLINSLYVLTAAHCIKDKQIAGVRVGDYDIESRIDCVRKGVTRICESKYQDIGVISSVYHPSYGRTPAVLNDIGLLRLHRPVNLTYKNAGTICLPVTQQLRENDISGEKGTVIGWGLTENHQTSDVLRKVEIPIISPEACFAYYIRKKHNSETYSLTNTFCAGELGRDSCKGDSGGPLALENIYNETYKYVQFGIVSYGPSQCGSNIPGVYTDVRKFMKWILDNIQS